jgi:hypothetical protein
VGSRELGRVGKAPTKQDQYVHKVRERMAPIAPSPGQVCARTA